MSRALITNWWGVGLDIAVFALGVFLVTVLALAERRTKRGRR